ncbi:short-chain dehydrogenase [Gammaproteobacteria bacterium 45_16_T64]|nr:short-chain dehydrogenase [Gammaproteobacteria bacterium 45_16_T64]
MNWNIDQISNLDAKTVLITGANSGIGLEAAKILASKGAEVILACRNPTKGKAALETVQALSSSDSASLMELDLASLESIRAFTAKFSKKYSKLDILINNAGIMAPPFATTNDGFESQFGTNHLGHFALTGQLLPLLEAADFSRVVVLSSVMHRMGKINLENLNAEKYYQKWIAYGQSKLANLMFAKELQRRLEQAGSNVMAVAAHPGYSATNLTQHTVIGTMMKKVAQPQDKGCLPTLFAATSNSIAGGDYIGPDGWMEIKGNPQIAYVAPKANNLHVASRLWDVSQEMTGIRYLTQS